MTAGIKLRSDGHAGGLEPRPTLDERAAAAPSILRTENYCPALVPRIMAVLPENDQYPLTTREIFERINLGAIATLRTALRLMRIEEMVECLQVPKPDGRGAHETVNAFRKRA